MFKSRLKSALLLASAVAVVMAIVPSFAPAQNGTASESAQTPAVRSVPPALPGPAGRTAPPPEDDPIPGETDPTLIERVNLDDMSLSAIVVASNPDNNIAMIEHEGMGYLVHKGSRIGAQNGVVREITASSIIIEEPSGGPDIESKVVELTLPQ
ncbi:MAG: hypothetical protein LBG06_06195 [Deltaproteobacteria bacterium]|jgi:type IV pilus assembly protein PilP|nr:hypothetical protein [Deltaproteobacteria bacterium]